MAPTILVSPKKEEELQILGRSLQTFLSTHNVQQLKETAAILIETADYPELSSTHRIAAFNALCGFVDQCLESRDDQVRNIAISQELCSSLLQIYLGRYEYSRPKSMKQLLGSVIKAIARQPKDPRSNQTKDSIEILVALICNEDDTLKVKPSFHVLSSLMHKDIVLVSDVLAVFERVISKSRSPTSSYHANAREFLEIILNWCRKQEMAPIAGTFISTFLKSFSQTTLAGHDDCLWTEPLAKVLHQYPEDFLTFRIYVMPGLFALNLKHYWSFLLRAGLRPMLGLPDDPPVSKPQSGEGSAIIAEHLFGSLQVGKELGIIELTDISTCPSVRPCEHVIQVCDKLVGGLMGDADLEVRLSGMSLLTSSKQQSRPLTSGTITSLQRFMPLSYLEPDAKFRGEFLSLVRNLVDRIKAVTSSLFRTVQQHLKRGEEPLARPIEESLRMHKNFVQWLVQLSVFEIHSNSSYQRHFTALKIILILVRSGLDRSVTDKSFGRQVKGGIYWTFSMEILDKRLYRVLMDALMDPFEDVRQLAASILKLKSTVPSWPTGNSSETDVVMLQGEESIADKTALHYESPMSRSKDIMLSTGRIDHADGFARFTDVCFYQISHATVETSRYANAETFIDAQAQGKILAFYQERVSQIAAAVRLGKDDLLMAVDQFPIHGMLTSVRYILEEIANSPSTRVLITESKTDICEELESLMQDIWSCVKGTLCNDAPEGYMPEDGEEDVSMTTRDLLSYCWRALKESSLLLRSLVENINLLCNSQAHEQLLESMGTLCFTQLAELRHRGAFSTVAQSFASVCLQCQASSSQAVKDLRVQWYSATLQLIELQGNKITRRSAGIPSAMVGLLASGLDFSQAVKDLEKVVERDLTSSHDGQTDLPQVHALNCLRAMFASTKLVSASEQQIIGVISIAAKALSSELWPIRNCGLMLFRGLMDRLLGSHESFSEAFAATVGSRLAYERYPGLLSMLTQLLGSSAVMDDTASSPECLFPALDLMRRAPPPINYRIKVLPLVLRAAGSPQWHIREAAARAFAALSFGVEGYNLAMLEDFDLHPENEAHGRLLCVKYIFHLATQRAFTDVEGRLRLEFLSQVLQKLPLRYTRNKPPSEMIRKILAEINVMLYSTLVQMLCDNELENSSLERTTLGSIEARIFHNLDESLVHLETFKEQPKLSPGRPGLESFIILARVLRIVAGACLPSKNMLLLDDSVRQIGDSLGSQQAEECEHILNVLSRLLESLKNGDTVRLLLTKALSLFLVDNSKSAVDTSLPSTQEERRRDLARSTFIEMYGNLNKDAFDRLEVVRAVLADLDLRRECLEANSPASVQGVLAIWGTSIDAKKVVSGSWTETLTAEAIVWIRFVRAALLETSEFAIRHAAVLSLDGLRYSLASKTEIPKEVAVPFYMAVYTALVDDDEDIRKIAAVVVGRIRYSAADPSSRTQSAPFAARVLCNLLLKDHHDSPLVVEQAMALMIGQDSAVMDSLISSDLKLRSALQEDDSLFVVEKQNLFIDPVREASTWAAVLKNVSTATINKRTASILASWTLIGLNAMVAHAQNHVDGTLGWTSKPEVFALGMQILAAADVVLEWRSRSLAVTIRASQVRALLVVLVRDAPTTRLHELWVQRAEKILLGSVRLRVERIAEALSNVQECLSQA